jgi:death on curing protein
MRYLTVGEVLELHRQVITRTGGSAGVRDQGALESAVVQPCMPFSEEDLYPTLVEKAAALGFSLIQNHPFVDGNKRVGHAAMEMFLVLNSYQIVASVDEQEQIILQVVAGKLKREGFTDWLRVHIEPLR